MKTLQKSRKQWIFRMTALVSILFQLVCPAAGFSVTLIESQAASAMATKQYNPQSSSQSTSTQQKLPSQSLEEAGPLSPVTLTSQQTASTQKQLSVVTGSFPNGVGAFHLKVCNSNGSECGRVVLGTFESYSNVSNFSIVGQNSNGTYALVRRTFPAGPSDLVLVGIGQNNFGTVKKLTMPTDASRTIAFSGDNIVTSGGTDNYYGPSTRSLFYYVIDQNKYGTAQSTPVFSAGQNNLYIITTQTSPINGQFSPKPVFYLQIEDKTTKTSRFIQLPGSGESFGLNSFAMLAVNEDKNKLAYRRDPYGADGFIFVVDLTTGSVTQTALQSGPDLQWLVKFLSNDLIAAIKNPNPLYNFSGTGSEYVSFYSISQNRTVVASASAGVKNQSENWMYVISSRMNPITGQYLATPALFVHIFEPTGRTSQFIPIAPGGTYTLQIGTGSATIRIPGTSLAEVRVTLLFRSLDAQGRVRNTDTYEYLNAFIKTRNLLMYDMYGQLTSSVSQLFHSTGKRSHSFNYQYDTGTGKVTRFDYYEFDPTGAVTRYIVSTYHSNGKLAVQSDYTYANGKYVNYTRNEYTNLGVKLRYTYQTYDSSGTMSASWDYYYVNGKLDKHYYYQWTNGTLVRFLTQTFYSNGQTKTWDDYNYTQRKRYLIQYNSLGMITSYIITSF